MSQNQNPSPPPAKLDIFPLCPHCGEETGQLNIPEGGRTEQITVKCDSWECGGVKEFIIPAVWVKPIPA